MTVEGSRCGYVLYLGNFPCPVHVSHHNPGLSESHTGTPIGDQQGTHTTRTRVCVLSLVLFLLHTLHEVLEPFKLRIGLDSNGKVAEPKSVSPFPSFMAACRYFPALTTLQ